MKKVLIVGTGLGALSTGLRLISRGYQVTFLEKNKQPGGRLNQLKKDRALILAQTWNKYKILNQQLSINEMI